MTEKPEETPLTYPPAGGELGGQQPPPPQYPQQPPPAQYPQQPPPAQYPQQPPPQYLQGPPPPQGYVQAPVGQQMGTTVVVGAGPNVTTVHSPRYRDYPVQVQCPSCQQVVSTQTSYVTGLFTWMVAGIICVFGGWLGCFLIPLFLDVCKDVEHTCPNCKTLVGKFDRLS
ncbi:lipopolysaccharide-induced tumor necrosis factor-alpha factor homolog [Saccoglossus kowalevskii]|uniref:Cell death-inducing p53-target protein 1 homolog n=1 Tax=Saccoglossus kowalevskii TaxID=10224 RepID=A0ABM0GXN2_SACKO|nr:PREDICTED: cell death-inducing p53-target protein 1 homolog [Saccoglossus kowalevskii]